MSNQSATSGEQRVQQEYTADTPRNEIISDLPEKGEQIARSKVTLLFIAQAMAGEMVQEVKDGRHEFTVPLSHIRRDTSVSAYDDQWAIYESPDGHYVDDGLKSHNNNKDEYREWDGPFDIKIKSVSIQPPNAFGELETVTLEDVPVDALRTVISLALLRKDQPFAKWFHTEATSEEQKAAIEQVVEAMDAGIKGEGSVDDRDTELVDALSPVENGDDFIVDATPRPTKE